jgi:transcriptional regulator with AAA-type ATPase domain
VIQAIRKFDSRAEDPAGDFKGKSKAVQRLLKQALVAARGGDRPILITGSVGAGKSHLARYIHSQSARARGPLVFFDCGALHSSDPLLRPALRLGEVDVPVGSGWEGRRQGQR